MIIPAFGSFTDIQASRKAADGNVSHVRRLQNPCDDDSCASLEL